MVQLGYALSTEEHGPSDLVEYLQEYLDAGYDHVYVHQVGPNQKEFLDVYEQEIIPSFA